MGRASRYSPEVQERAVRWVNEQTKYYSSQWVTIAFVAVKIGRSAETLSRWVRKSEAEHDKGIGLTTDEREL